MFRFRQAADVAFVLLLTFIASNVYARTIGQDDSADDLPSGVLLDSLSQTPEDMVGN